MRIVVVMGYVSHRKNLQRKKRLWIIYPERLNQFVTLVMREWMEYAENRVSDLTLLQQYCDVSSYEEIPVGYIYRGEVPIKRTRKKRQSWLPGPWLNRKKLSAITGDPQTIKILWSHYYKDKDFVVQVLTEAHAWFLKVGGVQKGDKTLKFINLTSQLN